MKFRTFLETDRIVLSATLEKTAVRNSAKHSSTTFQITHNTPEIITNQGMKTSREINTCN